MKNTFNIRGIKDATEVSSGTQEVITGEFSGILPDGGSAFIGDGGGGCIEPLNHTMKPSF